MGPLQATFQRDASFQHGYPRECRSTTDRITRTHVRPYELQDPSFLPSPSYSRSSPFRLCNLFGTIPSHKRAPSP